MKRAKRRERLIDAMRLVMKLSSAVMNMTPEQDFYDDVVLPCIAAAPTVDAVKVVRCECCKHGIVLQHSDNVMCHGHKMPKNGFCSYGERRSHDTGESS